MSLVVNSTEKMPGVYILYPMGSLDTNTYDVLERKANYLISEGSANAITIDMKDLQYISSMGLRTIFKIRRDLAQNGGVLLMTNLSRR